MAARGHNVRMPALPSAPAPEPQPHQHREVAESFGIDAERYDRTRPPYPGALVDRIIAASPGHDVLDVGCGTGIEARQFQAAGCAVLGVEPDARMAEFARRTGVEVEVATFETWDPAGRDFDAVIAGTAWHWVDPFAGAAKAAQVLWPGGRLAPFHHVFQSPPEVTEARAAGAFGEPEQWQFDWERTYTRDEWLDQLPTLGSLTQLPPGKLAAVLEGVGAAIDAIGGSFTMHYTTVAVTAARAKRSPGLPVGR
jgi:SAM-dependent methyltransferase